MPEISRFLGIHAVYGDQEAQFRISPVCLLAGRLPPRVLALIVEWASRYQAELLANWVRCEGNEPVTRIPPLE